MRRHDVRSHGREGYLWEMKLTGKKQITIKADDAESVRRIAYSEGRTPVIGASLADRNYVVIEENLFLSLTEAIAAYEERTDDEIRERHKKAHGLTPTHDAWYDPRFDVGGEWDINPEALR